MRKLKRLFENNREWAAQMREQDPDFFSKLAHQQAPPYLWIGCSDSRVPANQIVGLMPGAVFVHRNIANVVSHSDMNCLSVIQYAVEVLKVQHILVCGHYGCGGVAAAMGQAPLGLIDNWLRPIKGIYQASGLANEPGDPAKIADRLCELNVAAQVKNVSNTTIVQNAWRSGQSVTVHGWIYSLEDGILKDLDLCIDSPDLLAAVSSR